MKCPTTFTPKDVPLLEKDLRPTSRILFESALVVLLGTRLDMSTEREGPFISNGSKVLVMLGSEVGWIDECDVIYSDS